MVLEKGGTTLAYDPDIDLTRLTNEALPNLEHYQDPQNKGKCRPRLEDLIEEGLLRERHRMRKLTRRKGRSSSLVGWRAC